MPQQDIPEGTRWVWVEQEETGHRLDLHRSSDFTGYKVVPGYPANNGRHPRPTKYKQDIAKDPAEQATTRRSAPKTGE